MTSIHLYRYTFCHLGGERLRCQSRVNSQQQSTAGWARGSWRPREPAAVRRSHAVFDGEFDPLALTDGEREREREKKGTALRDVVSVRRFRTSATRKHTITITRVQSRLHRFRGGTEWRTASDKTLSDVSALHFDCGQSPEVAFSFVQFFED